MEILFENRYHASCQMLAEFYRKHGMAYFRVIMIVGWLFFGYYLVDSILQGILVEMIAVLLMMAGIYTALSFVPEWYSWNSMRHAKKLNDGILPETVVAFGDVIEMREGMSCISVEYRKIIRVVKLKRSYVLMIGKRNGVILDPNGFTKGTFEEFKQFLREKRPDLNIPD